MLDIGRILERLNLKPNQTNYPPTLENLQLLMKQYLLTVPYENLDFKLHHRFSSNILKVYDKIVENKRGGICYESNMLFFYLIKNLGFEAHMIFAQIEESYYIGKEYPHLAMLVFIEEKSYLVDVASGENVREPLDIEDANNISISENKEYKIGQEGNKYILLVKNHKNDWLPKYCFTKAVRTVTDFDYIFEGDKYFEFATNAPTLVTKALENGRVTMTDTMIDLNMGDEKRKWNISEENRAEVLRDYFDIHLDFTDHL